MAKGFPKSKRERRLNEINGGCWKIETLDGPIVIRTYKSGVE